LTDLAGRLVRLEAPVSVQSIQDQIICQDFETAAPWLPAQFVDLLIVDPPYNLSKNYHGSSFKQKRADEYQAWFRGVFSKLKPTLKPSASIYVCSDWKTSMLIAPILADFFDVKNRITWERDKGRGATSNWKNNTEDIWFCTSSNDYTFNVERVKLKRRVMAPYRDANGRPKDWDEDESGNFRLTCPSNIWTDLTVPFWSMPENTDHPTQKPEKLMAKLILASSNRGDLVFDPFNGSGTTSVVAKKLGRHFCGIEQNQQYCCWTLKRLAIADDLSSIQGYADGVFWERNSFSHQPSKRQSPGIPPKDPLPEQP
jgi:site-specific DNA-methyltransferase (adenine-specific)